jgi:hypothetical protein
MPCTLILGEISVDTYGIRGYIGPVCSLDAVAERNALPETDTPLVKAIASRYRSPEFVRLMSILGVGQKVIFRYSNLKDDREVAAVETR